MLLSGRQRIRLWYYWKFHICFLEMQEDLIESYESYEASLMVPRGHANLRTTNVQDTIVTRNGHAPATTVEYGTKMDRNNSGAKKNSAKVTQTASFPKVEILIHAAPLNLNTDPLKSDEESGAKSAKTVACANFIVMKKRINDFCSTRSVLIQATVALLVLCLPGNVMTFWAYREITNSTPKRDM